jgi:uncharacterized membrane protein (DUF4010 family)
LSNLVSLLAAVGIGLLIGLERGWRQRDEHAGGRIAGIRTYALLALGGALSGLLALNVSIWFGLIGIGGIIVALLLAHRARLAEADDNVSATNVVVSILTVMLGLAMTTGFLREAIVAGGVMTLILSMREQLHSWLRTLSAEDVRAVAIYGAITLVVLPLLPDKNIGPYAALNPRNLWLVVVFVTGLSFAGYWASKRVGDAQGTIIAAAIGATYSSTAVTAELSRRLRSSQEDPLPLRAGIAAATAMMPIRISILVAVLLPGVLLPFLAMVGPAIAVALLFAALLYWRARGGSSKAMTARRNPFDIWPAIGFATLVGVIVILSRWTIDQYGGQGVSILIGLTGLYDVDAAIVTASNLPKGLLDTSSLAALLALPVLVNSALKAVLVPVLGGVREGARAAIPLIASAILIAIGIALINGFHFA